MIFSAEIIIKYQGSQCTIESFKTNTRWKKEAGDDSAGYALIEGLSLSRSRLLCSEENSQVKNKYAF